MSGGEFSKAKANPGLNVNDVIVIMTLVTLFSPILMITTTITDGAGPTNTGFWIIAPIWTYAPEWFYYSSGFRILFPLIDPMILMFSVIPFLFGIQVVRYCQEKTTLLKTAPIGLLYNVVLFLILFANSTLYLLEEGLVSYSGPIPIQLLVGYFLIWKFKSKFQHELWND